MEYFPLCLKISQDEKEKFNLDFQEIVRRISTLNIYTNSFENPYDRCAYMYRNASCIISFVKECLDTFFKECPVIMDVFQKWNVQRNWNFCSFSCGPALDYLSFCLALTNYDVNFLPSFESLTIISKSAQWKHALQSLIESIKQGFIFLPFSLLPKIHTVNQNPDMLFNAKHKVIVENSDIVFMVKTLNFSKPDEFEERKVYFQNIIDAMKVESYLFCIDTKPSILAMFQTVNLMSGKLIYGPVFHKGLINEASTFPDYLKETYKCLPTVNVRGSFFVWEKTSLTVTVPYFFLSALGKVPETNSSYNDDLTNFLPSTELTKPSNITDNSDSECNSCKDNQCKGEVSTSSKRENSDIVSSFFLSKTLLAIYNHFSQTPINNYINETNEKMNATVEQEVKPILSNLCSVIENIQLFVTFYTESMLNKQICVSSGKKNELSSETTSSPSTSTFDTFLKKMEDKKESHDQLVEIKPSCFDSQPKFVVPNHDAKSKSVFDDLSSITHLPLIKSPFTPNKDSININYNTSIRNTIQLNERMSNVAHHPFMSSLNEFNVTHLPFTSSPIVRNRNLLSDAHHSSLNSLVEDLSFVTPQHTINPPVEPNRNFVKFPANELLSTDSSEGYFTTETFSSKISEELLNSNSIQNKQEKPPSKTINSVSIFSDSSISLNTKSKKLSRKTRKSQNIAPQINGVNKSNNAVNIPLYPNILEASTSNNTSSLNTNTGWNKLNDLPTIERETSNRNKSSSHSLKNEYDFIEEEKISKRSNLNTNNSHSFSKILQNESISQPLQKSVSTNTSIQGNYNTNSAAIQLLTNKVKSLINSFDNLTSQHKNSILRGNIATEPCDSHSCMSNSPYKNDGGNNIYNKDLCFQKPNAKEISTVFCGSRENTSEDSKLEIKDEEFGASQSSLPCASQSLMCCLSKLNCRRCCGCQKEYKCICVPTPNCPLHGCFHCLTQHVHSSHPAHSRAMLGELDRGPNIVIPLQNISTDILAQILEALKVTNSDSNK